MANSVWRGIISFGLVSIPIRLYTAARSKRTFLHQIHNVCSTRLKQPLYCPTCERMVDRSEVIKGYEYETGKYFIIDSDELKKIRMKMIRPTIWIGAAIKNNCGKNVNASPLLIASRLTLSPARNVHAPWQAR
jgi:non-homologous end joining protein Ku